MARPDHRHPRHTRPASTDHRTLGGHGPARPDRPPAPLTVDDALYRAIAVLGAMCFATLLLTVVGLLIKAAL